VTDERRGSQRIAAHLAGQLETESGSHSIAISRDVAAGGLLLFTRVRVSVGDRVKLTVVHDGTQRALAGTVLRVQDLEPETSTLWRRQVAVSVDENDPALASLYQLIRAGTDAP
jgi:hypothetical protein